MKGKKTQKYIKLFQVTLAVAVVYLVLKYLLPIVLPFVLSYFLCRMFYPWAQRLAEKTHMPLTLWSVVLVGLLALLLSAAAVLTLWYLYGQIQIIVSNSGDIGTWVTEIFETLCSWLADMTGHKDHVIRDWLYPWGEHFMELLREELPVRVAGFCVGAVKWLGKAFIVLVLGFIGAVLLMKNKKRIHYQVSRNIFAREITGLTARICQVSAGFFRCQAIIIAVIAVILAVGLRFNKSRYSIVIGIIIAFLDALPVIGSGTILLPWALVKALGGAWRDAAVLAVLYGICTVVREVLEPRLMGDKLGINEFYMLMATFIGIALFGVWGIFLGPLGMIMILEILRQMEDLYESGE